MKGISNDGSSEARVDSMPDGEGDDGGEAGDGGDEEAGGDVVADAQDVDAQTEDGSRPVIPYRVARGALRALGAAPTCFAGAKIITDSSALARFRISSARPACQASVT